jgi:uncharacterized protein YjiS (DUF1127 family)
MRREIFDLRSLDVGSLSPAQRSALQRRLVRQAHAARTRALRDALAGIFRSLRWLRPAAVAKIIRQARAAYARRQSRLQGLASLHAMTDYELRDVGLSRSAIRAAAWMDEEDPSSPGGGA